MHPRPVAVLGPSTDPCFAVATESLLAVEQVILDARKASSGGISIIYAKDRRGNSMGSWESEQMLALLKELSMLKVLDTECQDGPKTHSEQDAHRLRQQRHQEITEAMKALAVQKQDEAEQNPSV